MNEPAKQTSPTQIQNSELLRHVSKLVQKMKEASPTDINTNEVFYSADIPFYAGELIH